MTKGALFIEILSLCSSSSVILVSTFSDVFWKHLSKKQFEVMLWQQLTNLISTRSLSFLHLHWYIQQLIGDQGRCLLSDHRQKASQNICIRISRYVEHHSEWVFNVLYYSVRISTSRGIYLSYGIDKDLSPETIILWFQESNSRFLC